VLAQTALQELLHLAFRRLVDFGATLRRSRLIQAMPTSYLGVHGVRRQVDLTGPRYGPAINENPLEKLQIRQGRERSSKLFSSQSNVSRQSVPESNK
jgi:hypothetical protein